MTCWGHGAEAVGYYFDRDRARCSNCNRWAVTPLWFPLDRVLCEKCATVKHANCPCQD